MRRSLERSGDSNERSRSSSPSGDGKKLRQDDGYLFGDKGKEAFRPGGGMTAGEGSGAENERISQQMNHQLAIHNKLMGVYSELGSMQEALPENHPTKRILQDKKEMVENLVKLVNLPRLAESDQGQKCLKVAEKINMTWFDNIKSEEHLLRKKRQISEILEKSQGLCENLEEQHNRV